MRVEERKKRDNILSKYGSALTVRYQNYSEGSMILSVIALFVGGSICVIAGMKSDTPLWSAGLSVAGIGVLFIFITGLFRLLGQVKEMLTILIIKLDQEEEEGKKP